MRIPNKSEIIGKRVILRVDWNVTLGKALQIVDSTRIEKTIPTINYLSESGASQIIIVSHLGKPKGRDDNFSLRRLGELASRLLKREIKMVDDIEQISEIDHNLILLENIRFHPGEIENDMELAKRIATHGDIYVNEAFGESHREYASMVGVPQYIPSYAGLNLIQEVEAIRRIKEKTLHPLVVVMGGAKIEDKLALLKEIAKIADYILLGGKLANEYQNQKLRIDERAKVVLPSEGQNLLDIGEQTRVKYKKIIAQAKMIVWNGPMGRVEEAKYRAGTEAIFEAIVENEKAYSLVGGGDTLASITDERQLARIDHVSTGGGAMLKLLESGSLVAIDALTK